MRIHSGVLMGVKRPRATMQIWAVKSEFLHSICDSLFTGNYPFGPEETILISCSVIS